MSGSLIEQTLFDQTIRNISRILSQIYSSENPKIDISKKDFFGEVENGCGQQLFDPH